MEEMFIINHLENFQTKHLSKCFTFSDAVDLGDGLTDCKATTINNKRMYLAMTVNT